MKLYHGTNYSSAINISNNGIDLGYSKLYLDFGAGFYTTPSYEHAAITAIRRTDKYNNVHRVYEKAYIVEINYLPRTELGLSIKTYPRHSEEWGKFVLYNRLTMDILNEYSIIEHNHDFKYDVCCGEIADGNIANIAYQVNERERSPFDIDYNMFLKEDGDVYPLQYSFHTEKAISCIKIKSCGIIKNEDKYRRKIGKG